VVKAGAVVSNLEIQNLKPRPVRRGGRFWTKWWYTVAWARPIGARPLQQTRGKWAAARRPGRPALNGVARCSAPGAGARRRHGPGHGPAAAAKSSWSKRRRRVQAGGGHKRGGHASKARGGGQTLLCNWGQRGAERCCTRALAAWPGAAGCIAPRQAGRVQGAPRGVLGPRLLPESNWEGQCAGGPPRAGPGVRMGAPEDRGVCGAGPKARQRKNGRLGGWPVRPAGPSAQLARPPSCCCI
jgi:hypothetical protein